MTTATVKKVMQQRLTRGTPVLIADSFGQAKLRGAKMIVASKGPVKCNKGGRCAGDWCIGMAVFLASPESVTQDKEMGWRKDTVKVCLTHVKTEQGALVLSPMEDPEPALAPLSHLPTVALAERAVETQVKGVSGIVSWEDLAEAHRSGNLDTLALLARRLKTELEVRTRQVIDLQDRLLGVLTEE